MSEFQYPIGRFEGFAEPLSVTRRMQMIDTLAQLPAELKSAVDGLRDDQIETPYRNEGWTVKQLVHHVADSHMNSYVRFKLALTEEAPVIKPYNQGAWAELADSHLPMDVSLTLLASLHDRWSALMRAMGQEQWGRSFRHPELGEVGLEHALGLYVWHGRHHSAQVMALRDRMGW